MPRLSALLKPLCIAVVAVGANTIHASDLLTPKHEAGRCAIRGHCGKLGFFGKPLPCIDNGLAKDPDQELRRQLVSICGAKWSEGPVCCDSEQVRRVKQSVAEGWPAAVSCHTY